MAAAAFVESEGGLDVVVLPEAFSFEDAAGLEQGAEDLNSGETVSACSAWAERSRAYVLCPFMERAGGGAFFNSAALYDRQGSLSAVYRKKHPSYGGSDGGITPGNAPPAVFETDFGAVGVAICFDAYFPELWASLESRGADIVLFPSAFAAHTLLASHSALNGYYIVENGDKGAFFDLDGSKIPARCIRIGCVEKVATIDLDRVLVHQNDPHNGARAHMLVGQLMGAAGEGALALEVERHAVGLGAWLIGSTSALVSVREELDRLGIQCLRAYRRKARELISRWREADSPVPHGDDFSSTPPYDEL